MDNETFIDCNEKSLEMFACKCSEIVGHMPVDFYQEFQPDGRKSIESAKEKLPQQYLVNLLKNFIRNILTQLEQKNSTAKNFNFISI